ncbi:ARM repeat-containing protein [Multifurca ochricompacta]|uniref:MMS19 nucleotide excision repair protein n=1 Tax=Multifurca ochricompacta TaxID=376703 RepID=A0AAD4MBN2_9AGAM|nr:ARM repeat-containing protein [Multifurca ochricompacta]
MEAAERYVRTWVASPRDKEIEDIVSGIADGELKLVHIVKALGEYLTSEEGDLRNKGVEFLALVVGKCPLEKFNLQSVKVLVAFFASKLEDTETIIPALKGMLALTPIPVLVPENVVDICEAVFTNVKMQALVQVQRHTVFSIFDSLVARHRDVLKSMGNHFLSGYIALADGEKDPRNLMIAFAIARVLAIEFDISTKFEELFNITFCYFPITFRPPPNDPYGVTAEDLKAALQSCLSASPLFGNLAIPLFLDKVNAGSPTTKRDTLQTLAICLPVYGSRVTSNSGRKLWSSLKLEIFQPTDPETQEEALEATQVVIKTIYADQNTDTEIDGLAKDICEECIQILKEPEKSQAKPAIKVLCAFMSTTPSVSRYTISHAIPHLIKLFVDPDELPNRGPVLSILSSLVAAARDSTVKADFKENIFLLPFKDEVLGAFVTGLKVQSSLRPAIEGLNGLVTTPDLLDDEEIGFVVQRVNEVISGKQEDFIGASDAAIDLLKTISIKTPSHIAQMTLPFLFSALPDQAPARDDAEGREKYRMGLSALSRLCTQPNLFETLVVRLSVRLSLLYAPAIVPEDPEPSAAYAHALQSTLAGVLARKVENGDVDVPKYVDRLVPRLFNITAYGVLATTWGAGLGVSDPRIIDVSARLVNLVTQSLSAQKQETFVNSLFAAYFKGDITPLAVGDLNLPTDAHFAPFDPAAPEGQANLIALFSAAVIALHPEVKIPVDDEGTLLVQLLNWSIRHAKTNVQRENAWHIAAAIVNKHVSSLNTFLNTTLSAFWDEEIAKSLDPDARRRAISAWAWVSRALLVRNYPQALQFVNRFFELFEDAEVSWDAARAIGQVGTVDNVLTKRNHVVIKILHAQKYASNMLPKIIEGTKDPTKKIRQTTHLVALAALIKAIPKAVYVHELPTLMPLLLRGLSLPDLTLRAGVIDTLLSAAQVDVDSGLKTDKEASVAAEHAVSLTSVMLQNSTVAEMPDVRVRVGALKYLAVLPKIVRYDVLHPQKATVLRGLAKALDDPKRAVRKEAVDARTTWFRYSG